MQLLTIACVFLTGCPVSYSQELKVTGLWRDPNPHSQVPEGALDIADEVVFRRKGTAEPRPGFEAGTAAGGSIDELSALLPYDGAVFAVGRDGSTKETRILGGAAVLTEGAAELSWDFDNIRGVQARKNLYLTTSDAPRKLTAGDDAVASLTNQIRPSVLFIEVVAGGTSIANNSATAARAVYRRTDANGLVVRSAPTGRAVAVNTSGGALGLSMNFLFNPNGDVIAGDTLEIYRSKVVASAVAPSDVMFLAVEHEITAAEIAAGAITGLTFDTLDANLGANLYTNPNREGIERSNIRGPLARDLALYKGSLFASRIAFPHRLLLRFTEGGDCSAAATGIGTRTYTGTRTNASAVISGLSSTVGLQVGMILVANVTSWNGAGAGAHPVRITAINGADLTMSETWDAATDGAPVSLSFSDSIRISDGAVDRYYQSDRFSSVRFWLASTLASSGRLASTRLYAYATADEINTLNGGHVDITRRNYVLENFLPSTAGFSVWATHGDEYEPPLPLPTVADGEASTQDDFPNGLAWSKNDEPEHFMLGAKWLVGKEKSTNLRIFATTDALWILQGKGGGIFRLSGFGERSGWRVDEIDSTTYLLHPNLATQMGDKVYAWTNVGAVEISASGIIPVSAPAIGSDTRALEQNLDHSMAEPGAFCVANEKDGEVIFGLPDEHVEGHTGYAINIYVLNTRHKAWSKWFSGERCSCAAYDISSRRLMFGRDDSGTPRIERTLADSFRNADRLHSITVTDVAENVVTIAGGSGWTPGIGDLLSQGAVLVHVTALDSATVFTVRDATGLTAAAASVYECYEAILRWLPKTGDGPVTVKRYKDAITHWEMLNAVHQWKLTLEATRDTDTVVTQTYTTNSATRSHDFDPEWPLDHRALLPRSISLSSRLRVGVRVQQADARWRLSGVSLGYESVSTRHNR